MTEGWEGRDARRLDRVISDLLAGRRLKADATDAADLETMRTACRLVGSTAGDPRMSPEYRQRLAARLAGEKPPPPLSRRAALVAGVSAAGGIATGALVEHAIAPGSKPAPSRRGSAGDVLTPAAGTARWVDAGVALDDLQDGVPVRATAGAVEVFLVRSGRSVAAMSALCTHQPCVLTWNADRASLVCPCHLARFDVDGEPTWGPYPYRLPRLPWVRTRIVGGRVQVLGTAPR